MPLNKGLTYIGYDKRDLPFVLRYSPKAEAWIAIGFETREGEDDFNPLAVRCADDMADFITRWEYLP